MSEATTTTETSDTILGVDREIFTLGIARMMDSIGNSFLAVVLPLYIASGVISGGTLGLSVSLITGIIISAFGFLNSIGQVFTGRWSDRLGNRKLFIVTGLAILAIANFAYTFSGSYVVTLVIRAIQGVGVAFTVPATIALVNELSTDANRGGSMGTFNTFRLLGFGIGPMVAGGVVSAGPYSILGFSLTGFDAAFYIATIGAALGAVLVLALVADSENTHAEAGDDISVAVFDHDGDHLLDPIFALGVASLFMAVGIAFFSTIQTEINTHLNQGATLFGIEFGAFVISQVLLQTPIGKASDEYGRRSFILAGLVVLIPATLAQGLVTTPLFMIAARAIQGIAGAMVFAPALALAGDLAGEGQSGSQLSVLTMAFGLGSAIGPLSSGFLVSYGFIYPFAFAAVLALVGAVIVYTQVEEPTHGSSDTPSRSEATFTAASANDD